MAGKFLIGAASAALLAFGTAGTAQAADVMPVVVPVITPVVVVPGPVIELTSEHWIELGLYPAEEERSLNTYHDLDLEVTMPSGFGVEVFGAAELWFPAPVGVVTEVGARAFMTRGNAEFGVYAQAVFEFGTPFYAVGTDFTYETDMFTLESFIQANFIPPGGFDFLSAGTEVTAHLFDEKLDIGGGAVVGFDFGGFGLIEAWVGAQAHLGPVSPYVVLWWEEGDAGVDLGTELELPLGTSPLTLLGYAEVEFEFGAPVDYFFGVGIKFSLGGD